MAVSIIPPQHILPYLPCSSKDSPGCIHPPSFKLSLDPARFGPDFNVLFLRHYRWVLFCDRWSGLDTYQNAMRTANYVGQLEELGWVCTDIYVDVIGVGAGVVDALWNKDPRFRSLVKPINVSLQASNPKRWRNARSELAWNLRSAFRTFNINLYSEENKLACLASEDSKSLPNGIPGIQREIIDRLEEQCTTIKYKSDERQGGAIYVESKQDYKDRTEGEHSPDEFDSLALLFNDAEIGLEKRPGSSLVHMNARMAR
jgi:hypothetical protein